MCTIRDTRNGHYAKVPKDPKMRDQVTMGASQDSLEDKTLTVCHGPDFVNVSFFNFCSAKKETAKVCKHLQPLESNIPNQPYTISGDDIYMESVCKTLNNPTEILKWLSY